MTFVDKKQGYINKLAILVGGLLIPVLTSANPAGGQVTHGQASFNQQGKTLNITNTPGTIINWQDFSIAADEVTRFIQQNRDSAVLNRITGQNPSSILGTLQSNGQVYLLNPNGIVFGQNAQINVAGLVASTLNMTDADFLNGRMNFTGSNDALLQNFGIIETADGGDIYLIGNDVENHGIIKTSSGNILLAAGESVSIVDSTSPEIEVQITAPDNKTLNVGEIITQNGSAGIYAGLIEHQGIVKASTAVVEGGRIVLKAKHGIHLKENSVLNADGNTGGNITVQSEQDETRVDGIISAKGTQGQGGTVHVLGEYVGLTGAANIDASGQTDGGTVLIGGDTKGQNQNIQNAKGTYIALGSEVHANAGERGDGGTVIVWSDDATRAYGTITAKGGSASGDGGFVETSGGYLDVANIDIDIAAKNGAGGTWLLDPYNITITNTTTINVTGAPNYTPVATSSNINNADINAALDSGVSVVVDTTGGGGEAGDITINSAISKTAGGNASLTLNAHNNITSNADISSSSGTLNITLTADQDSSSLGTITTNSNINANGGNITFNAAEILLATGQLNAANITLNANSTDLDSTSGSARATNTLSLNSVNGIFGFGGAAQFNGYGSTINFSNSGTGTVRILNTYTGGAVTYAGTNNSGNIILESNNVNPVNIGAVTASNGYISFRTRNINISGAINAGSNSVYMMPYLAAAVSVDGSQAFDVTSAELGFVTAGNIFIGQDTFSNEATTTDIATSGASNLGGKNVWLRADNGISIGNNTVTNNGGEFYIDNVTTGNIATGSSLITADKIQFRSMGNVNIGVGGITSTNAGNVYLFGADVNIAGAINAGTNSVYLAPYLSNTPISIGGAQTFNLVQSDLTNITANMTYVGENLSSAVYASTVDLATSGAINIGNRNITIKGAGNITVGNNSFATGGGSSGMNIISSSGGSITTGTGSLISDGMTINSAGNLTIGSGGISTTTGGINLSAASNIIQNGNIVTSGSSFINLNTAGGTILMGSAVNSSTNGGNITYSGNGNVTLGRLYTGISAGTVSVTSTTGSINDAGAGNENIYASVANLTASTSIGGGGFDVFFNNLGTTNLNATSSSGGISINSTSAMNVGNVNSGAGTTNLTTSGGGSYLTTTGSTIAGAGVSLNSSQNLTIGAGGVNSAGNLSLTAAGTLVTSGNITTTGGGAIQAIANSSTFNNITSAGNIGIETDAITITNPINAGTNSVYIMPRNNNAISIDGVAAFDLTQGELNNITAGNLFIGYNGGATTRATTASISTNASTTIGNTTTSIQALNGITFGTNNFTATGADITFRTVNAATTITTGSGLLSTGILDLIAPGTVTVGGGGVNTTTDVAITAGAVALNGMVTTPTLYLEPYAAATAISVGGARPFDINQADINNIAATTTYIGNNSFVQNTNNANLATASPIDFGARNIIIDADNGIQVGNFALQATGGNLTLISRNTGFDITTNAGILAANNLTLTSARDIIIGSGGLNATASVSATATNNINQNGNITCSGGGSVTLNATSQDITMAAGTVTSSGNNNINYNAGGNITLALLDSGAANTTLNTTGTILDINGNGVNNIIANTLNVSSGGNASLDYTVTGGVNSAGVVGLADLRDMNAGGSTTTTTTTATTSGTTTTTESTNTIIDTITETTSETIATTSPGETLIEQTEETASTTVDSGTATPENEESKSEDEKEGEQNQIASAETTNDKTKTLTKKNLRTCN